MTYEIKATPPALDASASIIEQNAASIAKELQAVQELLTTLRRTFVGQRASSFFKQYDTSYQEMQEMNEILRSFAAELRAAAQRLRAADQG